jgi:hypothetical protein
MKVNDYFLKACKENGLEGGFMNFDPPTAGKVMQRYKELLTMDPDKLRNQLISKFVNLHVGDMPEVRTMPLDYLEAMIDQLAQAQEAGKLNLETDQGIKELERIVTPFIDQEGG